jgi:hypothetical protein
VGGVEGLVRVRVWVGCIEDGIGKGKSVVYRRGKKTGYKRGNIVVMRVMEMVELWNYGIMDQIVHNWKMPSEKVWHNGPKVHKNGRCR